MTATPVINVNDILNHRRTRVHTKGNELKSLLFIVCVNYVLHHMFRILWSPTASLSTARWDTNIMKEIKNKRINPVRN